MSFTGGKIALNDDNVKTINGASIVGTGNLVVSGSGASWGSITGTLSSQTDLQTKLNDKQDTLVSATNIKTINGNTILGSGDMVISGGSGLAQFEARRIIRR